MRVGFVVNPVAGMGGRVGLKGTDGVVDEARERGAEPCAEGRAVEALEALDDAREDVEILTAGGAMGEDAAREAGYEPRVVSSGGTLYETTDEDTREAVSDFAEEGVEVVLFVGGDGTAVDVARALESAGAVDDVPVLGVPGGVKVYSSVFAHTPRDAGRIARTFERSEERDVSDIDEGAYREGELRATPRAVVRVPVDDDVQESKSTAGGDARGIARGFTDDAENGTTYVLGPGGTVATIKRELGFEPTLLGVDVWRDGEEIARDASEEGILDALGDRNVVVVSPIGGQGFVLGRGNQQISPAVLRRSELTVVATRDKLDSLDALRVDTGDEELRGWTRVRVGRDEWKMVEVV